LSHNLTDKNELVKAALLGTQRYNLAELDPESQLGQLYVQLDSAAPPHRLLSIAGAYFLRQRAGEQPSRVSSPRTFEMEPDPNLHADKAQQLAACNKLASQSLAAILWGYAPDLLGEFLIALHKYNQRLPQQHLPTVLARGEKSVPIRSLILPVLGSSGRWLATKNPVWSYATERATTWDGAVDLLRRLPTTKRQGFYRQLRKSHPTLAREILSNQWKSITSAQRASYIKLIDESLSVEDEDFLELALNDRNHVVRRKAAELLAKVPGSKLGQRMIDNTRGFIIWSPEKEMKITVSFPKEITPQLIRDGVLVRTLRDESRVRSYQMQEMVGAIPLTHWTSTWDVTPTEIVAALHASRWPRTLKQSFVKAAERQKNIEWAKVLLADDKYGVSSIRLINLLSIEECETILRAEGGAEFEPLTKASLLVRVLRKRTEPWPMSLASLWFEQLVQHLDYDLAQRAVAEKQITDSLTAKSEQSVVQESIDNKASFARSHAVRPSVPKGATQKKEVNQAKSIDPILRLLIRQSGRSAPVELTQQIVDKFFPYVQEFNVWRPVLQELISTIKFRQTMLENIKKVKK